MKTLKSIIRLCVIFLFLPPYGGNLSEGLICTSRYVTKWWRHKSAGNWLGWGFFLLGGLGWGFISCSSEVVEDNHSVLPPKRDNKLNISQHIISFDKTVYLESGDYHIKNKNMDLDYAIPSVRHPFDIHMDVLPFYLYGDNNYSGDYYAVDGYIIAHNGELNYGGGKAEPYRNMFVGWESPYMKKLTMTFALVDANGNDLTDGDAEFYGTPQPQTTITSTTYTTGMDLTFNFTGTMGAQKNEEGKWKPTIQVLLPPIFPSLVFKDNVIRNIPDQTVEHNVVRESRTIIDDLITNNDNTDKFSNLPPHTRNDQIFHFSWVWHVNKGHRSACDYSKENMNIRIELNSLYRLVADLQLLTESDDVINTEHIDTKYNTPTDKDYRTVTFAMPAPNRTPIGKLDFANATRNYATNVYIWNTKDLVEKINPYCLISQGEHFAIQLPEGTYTMQYDIANGDDGHLIGHYQIQNIEIKPNETHETSTLDGKKVF